MRLTIDQTGITPCKLLSFDDISVGPIFARRIQRFARGDIQHHKLVFVIIAHTFKKVNSFV